MMEIKYFSVGSESEAEGLTLATRIYDGDRMIMGPTKLYKPKEITKKEYDEYTRRMNDSNSLFGMAGLVNEEGLKKAEKMMEDLDRRNMEIRVSHYNKEINFVVKKIKKQLALGIIEEDDIDTEIELNNMSEFKDEIKRRLAEK